MKRTLLAALVAAGVAGVPTPATAAEGWVGSDCGYTSTNDPTGVVHPDPDRQFGYFSGGPVMVLSDEPVVSTTLTCSLQLADDAGSEEVVSASTTWSGPVALMTPTAMAYTVRPGQTAYLCTTVSWVTASGSGSNTNDYDPVKPGVQCAGPRPAE